MNPVFQCPKCRNKLNNTYSCSYCSIVYFKVEGFFDFSSNALSRDRAGKKLSNLLSEIQSDGYTRGLEQFLKSNSEFEHRFNKMEGSIAFRIIRRNNTRCLVINSDLGNIPENLSQVFDEVYSLDTDMEKILIQKFRFEEKKISNIILIRADSIILPFPDKHFDLVVLAGIKIGKKGDISKKQIIEYFKEIKRVLSSTGCLCAGVANKYGLKIYGTETEHNTHNEMFSDTFYGYKSTFSSLGFKVKPYWVLPSYRQPHYSSDIEDAVSLKWFFRNFDKKFSVDKKKSKMIGLFLKKSSKMTSKLVMKLFCPSFLFYCYNENIPKTLEDTIKEKTGFENCIQYVRRSKVTYILIDRFGSPKKILSCNSMNYDLTEKIVPIRRIFPKMKDPDDKITIDDWFEGEILDRLNPSDVKLAMKWLTNFQNQTSSELLTPQEIDYEIKILKNDLDKIEALKDLPYCKWLEDYKDHISNIKLKKTGVHGDFSVKNILIDHNTSSVNVIDWDWRFQEKGNPLYDFMWLATNIMMLSDNILEEFRSNLNGNGKAIPTIKIIRKTMKEHFQADLDFIILLRFIILRFIPIKLKTNPQGYLLYIELLKILSSKESLEF